MKKWGALAVAVLSAAVMLVSSAGAAPQSLNAQLSTRTGANLYLVRLGLSPRGFVIQRGDHNYAGPTCPGAGWNCTTAKRVLQISDGGARSNQVDCTPGATVDEPGDCEIVQTASEGTNSAECNQSSADPNADQKCVVFQTNSTGANDVTVDQSVDTSNYDGSTATQDVSQYIGIKQTNGAGSNSVTIQQSANEPTSDTLGIESGRQQSEAATQGISLTQNATGGDNSADVTQSLTESENFSADGQNVVQLQNASSSEPNTNAGISQTSGTGTNDASLGQSHSLTQTVTGSPGGSVIQKQGSEQGGLNSRVTQASGGKSTFTGSQSETQTQNANVDSTVAQNQIGPMWGDPQSGNPNDTFTLTQTSTQHNDNSGAQHDEEYLNCDTSGSCGGGQVMTQNTVHTGQPCTGKSCHLALIDGNRSTCPTACATPNSPPPPQQPGGTSTCALIATVDNPPAAKQIKVEVQDPAGVSDINVDTSINATTSTDPAVYQGSTDPITVTATKTDPAKGAFVRLTITNGNGATTTCDPFIPASHTKAAAKTKHTKAHVAKAKGLTLKLSASGLVYGQPKQLTLIGSVPTGKAGEKVDVLTSTCGFKGTAKLATLKTGPGGVFRFSFAPALGSAYAVRWNGRTSAKKGIRVQPQIALVKVGSGRYRIDVSTTNGVFLTGTKVSLQALAGGHWKTVTTGKLAPNSPVDVMTAVSSATVAGKGAKLRAVVPATACYSGAVGN